MSWIKIRFAAGDSELIKNFHYIERIMAQQ